MSQILRLGSKGPEVLALQKALVAAGAAIAADGAFGPATDKAVRDAQLRLGLVVDGLAGPQTIAALDAANAPAKSTVPEPDKKAMELPCPVCSVGRDDPAPPPNVGSLVLLDTARSITEIIVHCAATPEGKDYTVDDIRSWHKARGWTDVGYHYIVHLDGRISIGRPVGQVGSHVAGHNTGTIGICYIGGVAADAKTPKDTRTQAQRSSLLWLTQQLRRKHRTVTKVTGHNQYAAKACPSFSVQQDALSRVA